MKIECSDELEYCNDDDVLDLGDSFLCRLGRFKQEVITAIGEWLPGLINEKLKNKGIEVKYLVKSENPKRPTWCHANWREDVPCQILKINSSGWQKGKFRIKVSIEFELDKPENEPSESPLDDLRRIINETTS
ncbi:hypothetical protein B6N60_04731 [Richelia sinica FACHB-800]|uniref:KGK family protein n=1 Tax=Richelia sinica FACHB-800 TaxID=1357546 RepID=A0A975TCD4_9NOST|nr:KGK domain-containing protein [Richelia sinica]MBD2667339.1 hypothetical protein [Richelia sinica FACHB-800]QXE26004.1 hypothetical protein B6N60_04731 [Richelia sinica FACHB-800]